MINADPYAVRAALDITTWQVPDAADVSRALRRHVRSRARRRHRIGLIGVATGPCWPCSQQSARSIGPISSRGIRGMDVLPHGSTNARLVHPEPDRRTRLGNHDSARRATQRCPVLSGSWRCRCYLGSPVAEEANTPQGRHPSANYAERSAQWWWSNAVVGVRRPRPG
jgi:hypothetical protein